MKTFILDGDEIFCEECPYCISDDYEADFPEYYCEVDKHEVPLGEYASCKYSWELKRD